MAYDAEHKFYDDYHTPMVLLIPVPPARATIDMLQKVQRVSGRKIGALCVGEYKRCLNEITKGIEKMEDRAKRDKKNSEFYDAERALLEDHYFTIRL